MIELDELFNDIESIDMNLLTPSRYDEVHDVRHYTTFGPDYDRIYDIVILTTYEQVVVNVTKLMLKNGRTIHLGNNFLTFPRHSTTLKQDIIVKLRSVLGLWPVLNDSYEFEYRGGHFLIDTLKDNPGICVVLDADDDYKPVLSVSLDINDELAPGKEIPDGIIRLMYY